MNPIPTSSLPLLLQLNPNKGTAMKMTLIPTLALIGIAMVSGCTDAGSTAPANGYHAMRSDRGLNLDTDSPSAPMRDATGLGGTHSNLPQGANAPEAAAMREATAPATQPTTTTPPPATPTPP